MSDKSPKRSTYDVVLDARSQGKRFSDIAAIARVSYQRCQQLVKRGVANGDPRALVVPTGPSPTAKWLAYTDRRRRQQAKERELIVRTYARLKKKSRKPIVDTADALGKSLAMVGRHLAEARASGDPRAGRPTTLTEKIMACWNTGVPGPQIAREFGITVNYVGAIVGRERKAGREAKRRNAPPGQGKQKKMP